MRRQVLFILSSLTLHATPCTAQVLDTLRSLGALREARTACDTDHGSLWSRSLCGPIALVDRPSRMLIANDTVPSRPWLPYADAFISTAPNGMGFANTAFAWAGRQWAMILLPLPADRFDRIALVMHEIFHREQPALGLAGGDPPNNHLDDFDGRRLLRLELNALASALEALASDPDNARTHAESALLFRLRRHALYPGADSLERALEVQEGLAEYTGVHLAMTETGASPARVAARLRAFHANPTYVRSFAYATGPALGLLLDHFSPTWRVAVRSTRDPARLLAAAIQPRVEPDPSRQVERLAAHYGGATIDREEQARDALRKLAMAAYRARLVEGPVLSLEQQNLNRNFDPQSLVGFDATRTIYPTGTFTAEWGSLEVTAGGALVSNDYALVRVSAPATLPANDARVINGDGWTLTLNAGWKVVVDASRPGGYMVRK